MLGDPHLSTDRNLIRGLWSPLNKAFFSQGIDDPSICVIEIKILEAELWESNGTKIGQFFAMAKRR